jgi:spore coat protein A
MLQIGSDGAFMASPVTLASPTNPNSLKLTMAPSERADLIIDFSKYAGQYFVLFNDAAAPFPEGDPDNDEPTVQRIMLFRVANKPPVTPKPNPVLPAIQRLNANTASVTRDIELFENFDQYGRLIQQLGQNGIPENYFDIVNINPKVGATEVWRFINLTGDTHPIHIHLINFQVISRQNFDVDHYLATGSLLFTGPAMPPDPNEAGWKDVLRMNPGQVTKIIAQFNAPGAWAYPEGDYMIHCHIVEHEDHEMMRRFYLS